MSIIHSQSGRKAVDISGGICATPRAGNGGKANKDRGLLSRGVQEGSGSEIAPVAVALEGTKGACPSSVDSSLGNLTTITYVSIGFHKPYILEGMQTHPFVIKVLDLLPEDKVFEQRRAADAGLQAVLVFNGAADIRGQEAFAIVNLKLCQELTRLRGGIISLLLERGRVSKGACC